MFLIAVVSTVVSVGFFIFALIPSFAHDKCFPGGCCISSTTAIQRAAIAIVLIVVGLASGIIVMNQQVNTAFTHVNAGAVQTLKLIESKAEGLSSDLALLNMTVLVSASVTYERAAALNVTPIARASLDPIIDRIATNIRQLQTLEERFRAGVSRLESSSGLIRDDFGTAVKFWQELVDSIETLKRVNIDGEIYDVPAMRSMPIVDVASLKSQIDVPDVQPMQEVLDNLPTLLNMMETAVADYTIVLDSLQHRLHMKLLEMKVDYESLPRGPLASLVTLQATLRNGASHSKMVRSDIEQKFAEYRPYESARYATTISLMGLFVFIGIMTLLGVYYRSNRLIKWMSLVLAISGVLTVALFNVYFSAAAPMSEGCANMPRLLSEDQPIMGRIVSPATVLQYCYDGASIFEMQINLEGEDMFSALGYDSAILLANQTVLSGMLGANGVSECLDLTRRMRMDLFRSISDLLTQFEATLGSYQQMGTASRLPFKSSELIDFLVVAKTHFTPVAFGIANINDTLAVFNLYVEKLVHGYSPITLTELKDNQAAVRLQLNTHSAGLDKVHQKEIARRFDSLLKDMQMSDAIASARVVWFAQVDDLIKKLVAQESFFEKLQKDLGSFAKAVAGFAEPVAKAHTEIVQAKQAVGTFETEVRRLSAQFVGDFQNSTKPMLDEAARAVTLVHHESVCEDIAIDAAFVAKATCEELRVSTSNMWLAHLLLGAAAMSLMVVMILSLFSWKAEIPEGLGVGEKKKRR